MAGPTEIAEPRGRITQLVGNNLHRGPFNRQAIGGLVAGWHRRPGPIHPPAGVAGPPLRHTYATLLVDAGASLPEVQRLLGHADLSTTQVYLKVAGRGLEEAALSNPARAILRRHP